MVILVLLLYSRLVFRVPLLNRLPILFSCRVKSNSSITVATKVVLSRRVFKQRVSIIRDAVTESEPQFDIKFKIEVSKGLHIEGEVREDRLDLVWRGHLGCCRQVASKEDLNHKRKMAKPGG